MPQNIGGQIINLSSVFILTFKMLVRKNNLFQRGDFQEVFDPPHYELFTLRDKVSLITSVDIKHVYSVVQIVEIMHNVLKFLLFTIY